MLKDEELTRKIIGCCFEVANELGYGFLEGVYERSLLIALRNSGLRAENQIPLSVKFQGIEVGHFFADLVVEGKILLELKAVSKLIPEHKAQLLNYLKASGIEVGLLVNFGKERLEWERFVI